MSMNTYSQTFKAEAVRKTLLRGGRTIADMAEQLNVPFYSLKHWLRTSHMTDKHAQPGAKRASDWSPQEQLQALQETYPLPEEALQAWCRERGLFVHQLESWKAAFYSQATPASVSAKELRALKDQIAGLERNLHRKDKALAEAAALLVLQKKYQALWEDEDK